MLHWSDHRATWPKASHQLLFVGRSRSPSPALNATVAAQPMLSPASFRESPRGGPLLNNERNSSPLPQRPPPFRTEARSPERRTLDVSRISCAQKPLVDAAPSAAIAAVRPLVPEGPQVVRSGVASPACSSAQPRPSSPVQQSNGSTLADHDHEVDFYGQDLASLAKRCEAQQAAIAEKDAYILQLTEMVESAKSSMQSLCREADMENNELHNELQAMRKQLEAAWGMASQEGIDSCEQVALRRQLADSQAMCAALRREVDAMAAKPVFPSPRNSEGGYHTESIAESAGDVASAFEWWREDQDQLIRETTFLKAEASRLKDMYESHWRKKSDSYDQIACELQNMRAALTGRQKYEDDEEKDSEVSSVMTGSVASPSLFSHRNVAPAENSVGEALMRHADSARADPAAQAAFAEVESLKRALAKCEETAEAARSETIFLEDELSQRQLQCEAAFHEVSMTKQALEELGHLAESFKIQAESELRDDRWFRLVVLTLRRSDCTDKETRRNAWSHGVGGWQNFASSLVEKLNERPTARFAQEIERHLTSGDKRLQALEDRAASQREEMSTAVKEAAVEFQQAEKLWNQRLRQEVAKRTAAEESLRRLAASKNVDEVVVKLTSNLAEEQAELDRLRKKLAEAEQTIGLLVVSDKPPQ
eukprot:TRINITY_DN26640_c0_g1_i1.p1 TRINITY_DN26640_c0_g1~~TRINITY_DN26640_c0_g1_i1.p1  ORF type:complete len:652 (-),score=152.87 TRINITY_DN26640_c0_g1_i1:129-2084(-)